MNTTYLALGSNEGDRRQNLNLAIERIAASCGTIVRLSSIYETAAWGLEDQPDFLNMVLSIETSLSPVVLLHAIRSVEAELGRQRSIRWGQRTVDIDILFYGDEIIDTIELQVPHQRLQDRRFVLVPLVEIAPDLIHPVFHKNTSDLLAICTDVLEVRKYMVNPTPK
jgi:2-amino-4-hydroxy-6-hydroxymethyldihydropteridine diphosphokinase